MKIQVTLFSGMGYKPISTIVDYPKENHYSEARLKAKKDGVLRICAQRHMTMMDLKRYGYAEMKMRKVEEE